MNMTKGYLYRFLAIITAASIIMLAVGCDGDEEATGLDKAQRLARASSETITMTDIERENAKAADNVGRQKGVAANVANRLLSVDSTERLQQELADLQSQIQSDESRRQAAMEQLMAFNETTNKQMTAFLTQADINRDERLQDAVKTTEDVLLAEPDNAAAAWLLGTIKLMQGRLIWQKMNSQSVEMQTQLLTLCRLAERIQTEKIVQTNLAQYVPDEAIKQLQQRLDEAGLQGTPSLRTQLASVKDALARLNQMRENTLQQRNENQQAMERMHKQYMKLLSKAENLRGRERFQLEQQAYALRGAGENPVKTTLHDYEARIEQADDELRMLDDKIALQQLRLSQQENEIAEIEQRIKDLQTAKIHDQVRQGLNDSSSRLTALNEHFTQAWNESQNLEQNYRDQRLETVNVLNESLNGFSRAQKSLQNPRRQQAAKKMIEQIHGDLMRLWNQDAGHYDNAVMMMEALETTSVMNEAISSQKATFKDQALLSRSSADKESAQSGQEAQSDASNTSAMPTESTETAEPAESDAEPAS
ncbi:MAG: hypothetical protein JW709_06055 [Sedimentisphaerales bacterium]|nr:hypothetical protein [Sedimentisphaerales bacterium]